MMKISIAATLVLMTGFTSVQAVEILDLPNVGCNKYSEELCQPPGVPADCNIQKCPITPVVEECFNYVDDNPCGTIICEGIPCEETNLEKTTRRFESQAYVTRIVVQKLSKISQPEWVDTFVSILKVTGKSQMERVVNSQTGEVGVFVKAYNAVRVDFGGDAFHTVTNVAFTTESTDGVYYTSEGCNAKMQPTTKLKGALGVEFHFDQTVCFDRDIILIYVKGQFERNDVTYEYSSSFK